MVGLRLVDVASIAPQGGVWVKWWTLGQVSHPVEHLVDRVLILLKGRETVLQVCRDLTNGTIDRVTSLVDHLLTVGVLCFVHVATIHDQGPISTDCGRFGDRHINSDHKLQNVSWL